jgi:hypothetical protein
MQRHPALASTQTQCYGQEDQGVGGRHNDQRKPDAEVVDLKDLTSGERKDCNADKFRDCDTREDLIHQHQYSTSHV